MSKKGEEGGYTELPAATTTTTMTDETSPLFGTGESSGGSPTNEDNNGLAAAFSWAPSSKRKRVAVAVAATVAAAVLLLVIRIQTISTDTVVVVTPSPPQPPPQTETAQAEQAVLYRSLCLVYGSASSARMIQTSMKAASQQWSTVPCFHPEHGPLLAPLKKRHTVQLNAFGSPDAILQVDFSKLAFPERQDMAILGFGGAFTEAAALNFHRLSATAQAVVLELLFGKTGLGYAVGRFPMNSCDFAVQSYSFDETVNDFDLKDFDMNVTHDVESGMVDMALRAQAVLRQSWGPTANAGDDDPLPDGKLRLFTSPWSPPAWMKKPTWEDPPGATHAEKMTYSSQPNCLKEGVGPASRYAKAWALYFSKFLTAYAQLGLTLDAVTVQNEPEFPAPWEACSFTPQTQHDFVAHHLGPQLAADHPDVRLLVFDHNKDHVNKWLETLLGNTSLAKPYIDGTAYHWYAGGMDRLLDGALGMPNMHRLQDNLRDYGVQRNHIVLGSESCHCPTTGYAGGDITVYWSRAERYAHVILADLAAGSNGWVEWNLILDGIGGPNHLGNLCESTLLAVPHRALDADDSITPLPDFEPNRPMHNLSIGDGRTREELNALGFPAKYLDVGIAVQPLYFYMGHISRYVRPGSVAVMGLVQESLGTSAARIFRPQGIVVAGGGENDLARNGIEITLWPCEGSTRQLFALKKNNNPGIGPNNNKQRIQVSGHDWLGNPTKSCIARAPDKDFLGLRLTECTNSKAGWFHVTLIPGDEQGRSQIQLLNPTRRSKQKVGGSSSCLVIRKLQNGGGAYGPRGGAQVTLGDCSQESAKWIVDEEAGEVSSIYFADNQGNPNTVCMTTGWPFLQMGAFLTPKAEAAKTVVILNEANGPANFALRDGNNVLLTASIPPRSIQTVLID